VSEPEWIARFWAKVDFDGPIPERRPELGPCHVWTASVNGHHGYGKFWVNGRLLKAHRIALELAGVPIPAGYIVDHLCRNVRCVRLEHLEPVTQRENFLRGDSPTATVGDWLTEFGITTYPQAPAGWKLVQRLAEGYGMNSATGRPLKKPTRSLSLAYLRLGTAQGATAILHHKAGAKTDGSDSWLFIAPGYLWNYCTDPDCDDDRAHLTADGLREASAAEIQALLSEGTAS
jgi:hypothetical protein